MSDSPLVTVFAIVVVIGGIVFGVFYWNENRIYLRTTNEGLIRKVAVRYDNIPVYADSDETNHVGYADKLDIYFIYGERNNHYIVAPQIVAQPENPLYIRKRDVIEWNSYLALSFANSPAETGREPVQYYPTEETARLRQGPGKFGEYINHNGLFSMEDAQLILSEYPNNVYRVMFIYDDCEARTTTTTSNTEDECPQADKAGLAFVKHFRAAHQFRRYVSRSELENQILMLRGIDIKENSNPSQMNFLGQLCSLFANCNSTGISAIKNAFEGDDIPNRAQSDILDPEYLGDANNANQIKRNLLDMAKDMEDYLDQLDLWENDYSFVPVEWIQQ